MAKLLAHAAETMPVGYVVSNQVWTELKASPDAAREIEMKGPGEWTILGSVKIAVDPDVADGHVETYFTPFSWAHRIARIGKADV